MAAKNKYGQYFTIEVIANFMTSCIKKSNDCLVLEPSCGKGVFLKSLEKYNFNNVTAYEIDNTLMNEYDYVKYESFISSPVEDKFDVVIGNPPYIRWKNLEQELKEELQNNPLWNKYFNSLCDYLFIFILKSIEQLKEDGELIFICSDYWMNTTHSQALRNYMCENGHFSEIYHFKEAPLFDKVTASFVIFRYVKSRDKKNEIRLYSYNKKGVPTEDELNNFSCFDKQVIPQFKPNSRWLLATKEQQEVLERFESSCSQKDLLFPIELYRIGDFCDIGNGMVSGLDSAFKLDNTNNLNSNELNHIISVLKAKDLERYCYTNVSQYVYLPQGLSEEDLKNEYPNFYLHFQQFVDKLNERYNYGRIIPYWEFVFPRNKKLFERCEDKIYVPCKERISHKKYFRFSIAPQGYYPLQDVTGIIKKKTCQESIEYILAYLNSDIVFEWLRFNGIVKGEIVEFSEAPIASIPYRPINWSNEKEVHCHNQITQEVREYIKHRKQECLCSIKTSLNQLIYD